MIPTHDIQGYHTVDWTKIRMPSDAFLDNITEDGLVCNQHYWDCAWLSWEHFEKAHLFERILIPWIDANSRTQEEFETLCKHVYYTEHPYGIEEEISGTYADLYGFDIGVASLTIVTAAIGGVPFTSCRVHDKDEDCSPYVSFYITERTGKKLVPYCKQHNCGLEMEDRTEARVSGLRIFASSITPLMNLAEALYQDRDKF